MWNASDLPGSLGAACRRILRAGVAPLLFQIAALALSVPALAQPSREPAPAIPAPPAEARQDLRQILEKSYEILPLHNGVMLRPRKERLGVRTIEVSGDTIAVNGERVTEGVLRAWLAADADPVLRLFHLPPRERQALFGLQAGARPEEPPAPEGPSGQPVAETEIPAEGELPAEAPETPETPDVDIPETPVPPEAPEAPEVPSSTTGSKVNLFGGVTVEKDELAEEAVAILGTVRVEGEVSREVTAVGGSVVINGRVGGDVIAVGGNVRLGPQAVVDGDVSSVGGKIVRAKGSQIHGQTSEVGDDDDDDDVHIWINPLRPFLSDTADFFWQLIWTGILGLLVCLCLLAAPGPMERAERHLDAEPWVAVLVGLLAQVAFVFLFIVVTILLVITIVGCAIIALYPFLFIALALAILLGYAAAAHRFGLFLEARSGRRFGSPYAVALVGVLALGFTSLLGRVVALGGGFLDFLAFALLMIGFLVQYVATTIGIGSLLLARFGSSRGTMVPAVPPPPPPPAPVPYDPVLDGPRPGQPGDPDRPWEPAPPPPEG
jgi:cytoskeletal protein CcmA (bactofilin family)